MNNQITSAAAFFRAANQKRVVARVVGGFCHEDWEEHVANLFAQVEQRGIDKSLVTVTEEQFTLDAGAGKTKFIQRPKIKRERKGCFTTRSADYTFLADESTEPSYGSKKGAKVENGSLVITLLNDQKLVYTILED
ncbi:hypothetical protein OTK49_28395 [Vibrio coralliirubri]|uniref:hypothetical protein n=1 Tax=Vibrio coralliirubri TaxID=1516159 RepID=UPI0022833F44|nr:hypothetical protein [Vibrio coralliirubri]MCY9866464.1 hypothetical protein [Vibrio coralliirubri]